jgi:hypothetical protein
VTVVLGGRFVGLVRRPVGTALIQTGRRPRDRASRLAYMSEAEPGNAPDGHCVKTDEPLWRSITCVWWGAVSAFTVTHAISAKAIARAIEVVLIRGIPKKVRRTSGWVDERPAGAPRSQRDVRLRREVDCHRRC